jgi:quercetin dioxygenase-like cupin family protein
MKQASIFAIGLICGAIITAVLLNAQQPDMDPVKISPQFYKVRLENDKVRVLEYHLKPGEKEAMHSHTAGILYTLSGANMRVTHSDGTKSDVAGKADDVLWREPVTHSLENIGTTEAHAIAVELKACK